MRTAHRTQSTRRFRAPYPCFVTCGIRFGAIDDDKARFINEPANTADVDRNTALSWILVVVLILAVAATIFIIVFPAPGEPFTELYLLGPDGKASGYPTNLTINQTANVTVGVVNHENAAVNYTLHVSLVNKSINTQSFSLANGQQWTNVTSFTPTHRGLGQKLEFALYKGTAPNVYRSVYLYLNVS